MGSRRGDEVGIWVVRFPRSTSHTSTLSVDFICRLPDNKTDLDDSVTAIADGALLLCTDKNNEDLIWSKQKTCLLFEESPLPWPKMDNRFKKLTPLRNRLNPKARRIFKTVEAKAPAAQILTEMLGVVCHREYFELWGIKRICVWGRWRSGVYDASCGGWEYPIHRNYNPSTVQMDADSLDIPVASPPKWLCFGKYCANADSIASLWVGAGGHFVGGMKWRVQISGDISQS